MTIIFDDLRNRDCSLGADGLVRVYDINNNNKVILTRQLIIGPHGELGTRSISPTPIDQSGEIKRVPVTQRWSETDQAGTM